jgi:NOL1/NOP2/fmu family ribosome biogenesis protein
MKLIHKSEKNKIIEQLKEQFGISKIPHLLLRFGKEKIRAYSGNLAKEELTTLDNNIRIENIGLYFAKQQQDGIRLSIDAVQLLKSQISKNILELTNKQAQQWLQGQDLDIQTDRAFKILKNQGEFLGCGKSTGDRITNFIPKERRIK